MTNQQRNLFGFSMFSALLLLLALMPTQPVGAAWEVCRTEFSFDSVPDKVKAGSALRVVLRVTNKCKPDNPDLSYLRFIRVDVVGNRWIWGKVDRGSKTVEYEMLAIRGGISKKFVVDLTVGNGPGGEAMVLAFANVYNNRSPSEGTLLKIGTKIEIIGKPPWTEKIKKIVDSIF